MNDVNKDSFLWCSKNLFLFFYLLNFFWLIFIIWLLRSVRQSSFGWKKVRKNVSNLRTKYEFSIIKRPLVLKIITFWIQSNFTFEYLNWPQVFLPHSCFLFRFADLTNAGFALASFCLQDQQSRIQTAWSCLTDLQSLILRKKIPLRVLHSRRLRRHPLLRDKSPIPNLSLEKKNENKSLINWRRFC